MQPKKTTWNSLITLALAAIASASALTAGEEPPAYKLDEFVVVSTRTPLSMERASPSVDLISDQEIEQWQHRSFAEAISSTPGLVLWSNGSSGSVTSLSARGTESNHTGFFLDGRRLNPGFGNQYDLGFLSLNNLQSIEVQKGASTVNFGSSGIGGVVNARLKSGLGMTEPEASLSMEAGSNDYRSAALSALAGTDRIGFSVSASALETDNERENDAYEKKNFTSRLDWKLMDQLYFEFLSSVFETEKELPGDRLSPTPFDVDNTTNWLVSPGVRYLSDELSVHLFYARSERNADVFEVNSAFDYSVSPPVYLGDFPISNEIDITGDEVDLQLDYTLSDTALLTAGAVYRNDQAHNSNLFTSSPLGPPVPYEESFQQWGGFARLGWQLSETFEVRGGARYDDYSEYDDEVTGNLSLIYHFVDMDASIFGKVANSYAPPSAVDLAYDSDTSTPLNAEESISYEAGFRHTVMEGDLTYSFLVFRNEIDQLLSYNPTNFDTFNIEEAVTQGAEVAVEYQATEKLLLGLGYTYLVAESDRLNDPRTGGFVADPADGVPLARRPNHLLQLSASYQFTDSLSVGLQGIGQFEREDIDPASFLQVPAEDFFVVRLVADWTINENWSIFGRVENLLDEAYASAAGYPALGRAGYLGVKYNF